jgi:FMN phosphatase YigB (HAD superfamily)
MIFSAVFFDVDDVILDTDRATQAAIDIVELPGNVRETFRYLYGVLMDRLRGRENPDYDALEADIFRWQRNLVEPKVFSRHVLIAIALERCGVSPTRDAVHKAADQYWREVAAATRVFPDVKGTLARLREEGTGISFATNSDGFLEMSVAEDHSHTMLQTL